MTSADTKITPETLAALSQAFDAFLRVAQSKGVQVGGAALLLEVEGRLCSMGRSMLLLEGSGAQEAAVSSVAVMFHNTFGPKARPIAHAVATMLDRPESVASRPLTLILPPQPVKLH